MSEAGLSKNQPKDFQAPVEKSEKSKTEEEILYLRNKRDELLAEQQKLISLLHTKNENFSALSKGEVKESLRKLEELYIVEKIGDE